MTFRSDKTSYGSGSRRLCLSHEMAQSLPTNCRVKDYKKRILLPLLICLIRWNSVELTCLLQNATFNVQGQFSGPEKELQKKHYETK